MMTRSCAVCGEKKSGDEAELTPGLDTHAKFWNQLHRPDCRYVVMSTTEKLDYFMEHGSPVSSEDLD